MEQQPDRPASPSLGRSRPQRPQRRLDPLQGGKVVKVGKRGSSKKEKASNGTGKALSQDEIDRAVTRVGNVIGGKEGKAFKEGIADGTLAITPKELKVLNDCTDGLLKRAGALVVERGYKPSKAVEFVDTALTEESSLQDVIDLATANGGKITELVGPGKLTYVIGKE